MKLFSKGTLFGDVLDIAHRVIEDHNYADTGVLDQLSRLGDEGFQRTHRISTTRDNEQDTTGEAVQKRFQNITGMIKRINNPKEMLALSRALALDAIVVNAVNTAQRAKETVAPETQITEYVNNFLDKAPERQQAIATLKGSVDDLVLSFVHTMHPTVFHSPDARRFEKDLIGLLQDEQNVKSEKPGGDLRLMQGKDRIAERFNAFIGDLVSGKSTITPDPKHPMTVSLETQTEKENYAVIRKELEDVVAAWNKAVDTVKLEDADRAALKIDATRQKKLFEIRTWGQGADADGREKATSQFFHESVQNNFAADGTYTGEIMDMRQNAKIHTDFISALIQVKHRNANPRELSAGGEKVRRYGEDVPNEVTGKTFDVFIEDFMKKPEKIRRLYAEEGNPASAYQAYADPKLRWKGHSNSIFQQLLRNDDPKKGDVFDDRADFISALIKSDYRLVPQQLHEDVRELTDKMYRLKKEFVGKYAENITAAGYDPKLITYDEMLNVSIPGKERMISLRGAWDYMLKRNGVDLLHGGLQYNRHFNHPTPAGNELVLDFDGEPNIDQKILMQNYLQGTRKITRNKEGVVTLTPLSLEDRATLMDTIKRLVVVNDAIDKAKEANSPLPPATRYQIANYSEPSDFLILLKLYQEAGLVSVEKGSGKVTQTKMGIMPLLETGEDLEKAGTLFGHLMNDAASKDIVRSYYLARGRQVHEDAQRTKGEKTQWNGRGYAEIMLGFSDGSATTGNYASQWKIYQAARELTELFDKEGIDVRFFQGRGRGTDRGGTVDPRLQMQMMPPEAAKAGIYDVTIQSDLPMDLAASEVYGRDYLTKAFLGALDATIKSRTISQAEHERMKGHEDGINYIATIARKEYNRDVRDNPDALLFFDPKKTISNPTNTSRRASRTENPTFDEIRAIPKEFTANGADLPTHNVGLGNAISRFVSLWNKDGQWVGDENAKEEIVITNREGRKVTGAEAFKALSEHPFHQAMMQTITTSMEHYDPTIAKEYGEITNSRPFVQKVAGHLGGLGEVLMRYGDGLNYRPGWANALDHIGHGIITSGVKEGKTTRPNFSLDDERTWGETLYNALFVTSQEVGHRELPGRDREPQFAQSA